MTRVPSIAELMEGPLGEWLEQKTLERQWGFDQTKHMLLGTAMFLSPALILWFLIPGFRWLLLFYGIMFLPQAKKTYEDFANPTLEPVLETKIGVNEYIAETMGLTYSHNLDPGKSFYTAQKFGLLPYTYTEEFEDLWFGEHAGHEFNVHEVKYQWRPSEKNASLLGGHAAILTIDFNRNFSGATLVTTKQLPTGIAGLIENDRILRAGGYELSPLDMVHPDFARFFKAYSNDQIEARYLLHPEYVERLINLQSQYQLDGVSTLFFEKQLIVLIRSENAFESAGVKSEEDELRIAQTLSQLDMYLEMAELLQEKPR